MAASCFAVYSVGLLQNLKEKASKDITQKKAHEPGSMQKSGISIITLKIKLSGSTQQFVILLNVL